MEPIKALNSFTHLFTNFDYLKITDDQKHQSEASQA